MNEECADGICGCVVGYALVNGTCQADPACASVTCRRQNEVCSAGACVCAPGFERQGMNCRPVDPCRGVTCNLNEQCVGGACECLAGYQLINGVCRIPDPCTGITCEANATCVSGACRCNAGFIPSGTTCIPDPCAGVSCPLNEVCSGGTCICPTGYMLVNGACTLGDLEARSVDTVCQRWSADYPARGTTACSGCSTTQCNAGTIDPTTHEDAMRRLNLFRWLVGVPPVGVDWTRQGKAQEAALMMAAAGNLSHSPDTMWPCYSVGGDEAAGNSNLALGYSTAASTVDGYIRDGNTPSLGHRRWVFFPQLSGTGFGQVGSGHAMWSLGRDTSIPSPPFVAYPAPGPFPLAGLLGVWSLSAPGGFTSPQVTIVVEGQGRTLNPTASVLSGGYGQPTLSFSLGEAPVAGQTYAVTVVSGSNTYAWRTTLVTCP